jgi:hypothetical protein
MRSLVISLLTIAAFTGILLAQSQNTVVVPAASPAAPIAAAQAPAAQTNSTAIQGALKMLQEMKATNEDTLRKQEATLEQLNEIEKEADQLRIYSKRG